MWQDQISPHRIWFRSLQCSPDTSITAILSFRESYHDFYPWVSDPADDHPMNLDTRLRRCVGINVSPRNFISSCNGYYSWNSNQVFTWSNEHCWSCQANINSLGSKCTSLHLWLKHPPTLQKLSVSIIDNSDIWLVGVYGSCQIDPLRWKYGLSCAWFR